MTLAMELKRQRKRLWPGRGTVVDYLEYAEKRYFCRSYSGVCSGFSRIYYRIREKESFVVI